MFEEVDPAYNVDARIGRRQGTLVSSSASGTVGELYRPECAAVNRIGLRICAPIAATQALYRTASWERPWSRRLPESEGRSGAPRKAQGTSE
jgi:hypothetical protein